MIKIEDVTDTETSPPKKQKPQEASSTQSAEEAEASEQAAAPSLQSPETDANAEEPEHEIAGNTEQDLQASSVLLLRLGPLRGQLTCSQPPNACAEPHCRGRKVQRNWQQHVQTETV